MVRGDPTRRRSKITGLCETLHPSLESFITPEITQTLSLERSVIIAILAFFLLDADSRIASEFSLNLHAALPCQRPGVIPRNTPPRPSCPSRRSGARQATPRRRRFHSGTGPFGSTPSLARWRRCDVWIHDPIRCLVGARRHPKYSPCALLITIQKLQVPGPSWPFRLLVEACTWRRSWMVVLCTSEVP